MEYFVYTVNWLYEMTVDQFINLAKIFSAFYLMILLFIN